MRRLYIVRSDPAAPGDYAEVLAVAEDEAQARDLAATYTGSPVFRDPEYGSVELLDAADPDKDYGVVQVVWA